MQGSSPAQPTRSGAGVLLLLALITVRHVTAVPVLVDHDYVADEDPPSLVQPFWQHQLKTQHAPLFDGLTTQESSKLLTELTVNVATLWDKLTLVLPCCTTVMKDSYFSADIKERCKDAMRVLGTHAAMASAHVNWLSCTRKNVEAAEFLSVLTLHTVINQLEAFRVNAGKLLRQALFARLRDHTRWCGVWLH